MTAGASAERTLVAAVTGFLAAMGAERYAASTCVSTRDLLDCFLIWCGERGVVVIDDLTPAVAEQYQRWLYLHRLAGGRPLAVSTQRSRLQVMRMLGRWMLREGWVERNPADTIHLPRLMRHLPPILSRAEVERLLAVPDTSTRIGVRDRAIMEVLYSTAMSTSQVVAITLADLAVREGFVRVGERDQTRLLPLRPIARRWLTAHQRVRPTFLVGLAGAPDDGLVFRCLQGTPMTQDAVLHILRIGLRTLGIEIANVNALLRNAVAVHLLDLGADVRLVGALLGHTELKATSRFLRSAVARLKEAHRRYHPAEQAHGSRVGGPIVPGGTLG